MLGMGLVFPVLPALVGEFTASREAQSYWFGALAVSYGVMQFFCAPLLGALSDRFGRRPILITSIVGLGLHYLLIAVAPSLWVMLLARMIGGLTGASFSVANAYASDVTPPELRAKAFGQIGAVFGVGFICGPMLGGLLGDIDLKLPFQVAAGFALLNAAYGYFLVPESLPRDRRARFSLANANPFSALLALAQHREIGSLVAVYALFQLAHMMLVQTWVLFTQFRFGWGPRENGISLFCVGVVATAVGGFFLPRLLAYFGVERLALWGLASGVFSYLAVRARARRLDDVRDHLRRLPHLRDGARHQGHRVARLRSARAGRHDGIARRDQQSRGDRGARDRNGSAGARGRPAAQRLAHRRRRSSCAPVCRRSRGGSRDAAWRACDRIALGRVLAQSRLHELIETRQEARAVLLRERARSAAADAALAQFLVERAARERAADRSLAERAAVGSEHARAGGEAARRERDVAGDHHVAAARALGDPVVGRVEVALHDDEFDAQPRRHAHPRIRDDEDAQVVARGDAVDLVLHRARIGVHVDRDHGVLRAPS